MNGFYNGEAVLEDDDFTDEAIFEDFIDDGDEEGIDDLLDDEGIAELMEAIDGYDFDGEDAEILSTLLNPAGALIGGLGSLFGNRRNRRSNRTLRARPRNLRPVGRPSGLGSRSFQRALSGFATKNELKRTAQTLDRKIVALGRRTTALGSQVRSVNNRVNTTQKRLSTEVNRLRRADSSQQRGIRALRQRDVKLAQDINSVRQTSLAMSLLGGGAQEYNVTDLKQKTVLVPDIDPSTGLPTGTFTPQQQISEIKLDPKGDSTNDLLPLLLLGGMGGSGGSQGGFDPLLLLLLLK